jgi:phosphatidylserine/phosphatidylglycerophosphate/cardiolipin synthase-like enzyme
MAIVEKYLPGIEIDTHREDFRLIPSGQELLEDISQEITTIKPGDKFWIKGMVMSSGRVMTKLIQLAETAAAKGADVRMVTDVVSLYSAGDYPIFLAHLPLRTPIIDIPQIKSTKIGNQEMFKYLLNHPDISFAFSSANSLQRRIFPLKGTDHVKSVIVGKKLYFGDKNYDDSTFFNREGFTVKLTNPQITEAVVSHIFMEPHSPDKPDQFIDINNQTQLIIDSGKPGRSLIYEQAIEMVRSSTEYIGMVLTTFPGKRLMDAVLVALEEGKSVDITTTKSKEFKAIHWYFMQRLSEKRLLHQKNIPNISFLTGHNHAKVLYTEHEALWGSHNLVEEGIILGTREAAIRTSNFSALNNIRDYHKSVSNRPSLSSPLF